MIATMIDIETLGLTPTSYVTQIGLCVADTTTKEYLYGPLNLWIDDSQPGKIDINTVAWWMRQDRKVAANVFAEGVAKISPHEAFTIIKNLVNRHPGCTIWGSPAMFDLPILTHLFGGKKPWVYNMERDLMTLYKLIDQHGLLKPPPNEMAHDGAADAHWQMSYLFNLLDKLSLMGEAP